MLLHPIGLCTSVVWPRVPPLAYRQPPPRAVTLRPTAAARGARPAAAQSVRPAGCPRPPAARPYRVPAPAPTPAPGLGRRLRGCAARVRVGAACLLYTSDAADEEDSVDLGGRRI